MNRDDEEAMEFFDKLTGKTSAKGATPGAGLTALRDALHHQIETMRAAETASSVDLTADEQAKMAVLKQQLLDRGLIGTASSRASLSITEGRTSWLQWLSAMLFGDNWPRMIAVAASVVFAFVIVLQLVQVPESDTDIVRGGDKTPELIVADAAITVEVLSTQLRQAGAEVLPVQINNNEWMLRVSVPKSVNREAIQKILVEAGIRVEGNPPYRLTIKSRNE